MDSQKNKTTPEKNAKRQTLETSSSSAVRRLRQSTVMASPSPSASDQPRKNFSFHEAHLTGKSTYFQGAFAITKGHFLLEGATKIVELDESDAEVFSYISEWVYTDNIKDSGDLSPYEPDRPTPDIPMYVDIWILGDYLGMLPLMNFVMQKLYNAFPQQGQYYVHFMLNLGLPIYEGTMENCSLRKWISDLFAIGLADFERHLKPQEFKELTHPDFLFDVFYTRARMSDRGNIKCVTVRSRAHKGHTFCFSGTRYLVRNSGQPDKSRAVYEERKTTRQQEKADAKSRVILARAAAEAASRHPFSLQ